MFLGKIFPIQLYIGFLEKSVNNKYASIGRVAHWAGYGNNAQNTPCIYLQRKTKVQDVFFSMKSRVFANSNRLYWCLWHQLSNVFAS